MRWQDGPALMEVFMVRRPSYLALCFGTCLVLIGLLAACGGTAAPVAPAATATSTVVPPAVYAATASPVPTQAEPTPAVEIATPTAEATATTESTPPPAVSTETTGTPEATQEAAMPTPEPLMEATPAIPPAEAEGLIKERATEAVAALKNKEMGKLATLVHPQKGLSFAPYQFIDETNLTLTREELAGALTDPTTRTWGAYDGTGDSIDLTFAAYYDKFVYNHDFAAAPNVSYNEFKGHGNTYNNVFVVYPNAIAVEYHFPGFDPQYEGMDWQALYLVFDKHADGNWYLVHITHGQWTI